MLKFHKIAVRPVVGHYNDDDDLVDEEVGKEASVYTLAQFADYLDAIKAEVEARNRANLEAVTD